MTTPSNKLASRINELTNRPRFTLPGTSKEIAEMQACASLVLDNDPLLAAEALHYVQQGLLVVAIQRAAGTTFAEKLKDPTNRPLFAEYSILLSGMMRRDMLLGRTL